LPAARAYTTAFGELHVVSVIFNPLRFASRYYLLHDFKKHVKCSGAIVHVAEAAQGDRPWEVTTVEDLQWRVRDELWLKESMINAAVARLPDDWQYVAWVDHVALQPMRNGALQGDREHDPVTGPFTISSRVR
jgi:hypothetical protein